MTLKRIQAETQTKISILGRGSIRDKKREEELRKGGDSGYEHLKDALHILVEANPPFSNVKLAAGRAEMRKMLIPLVMFMWVLSFLLLLFISVCVCICIYILLLLLFYFYF